jgi:PPP family 3-phenylpropionic acid transporter
MPYWRLSGFYFLYFATIGVLIPYWGLYLREIGFSATEIGQLMALLLATKIVAPNLWGWIADYSGRYMRVVRIAAFLSAIIYLGVYLGQGFWWLAAVMTGFSFFWNASLPQMEATTLNYLGPDGHRYGRVRLWGSIGFIILVLLLGPVVDSHGPAAILPVLAVLLLLIWLITLVIPERRGLPRGPGAASLVGLLRRREVLAFLISCLLMQASHAPLYTFFSIYLDGYHYSKTVIGALWAFGVVCEIGVFLVMHRIHLRIRVVTLLATSFVFTAIRWALIAFYPEQLPVMIFSQGLHAITFGVYHAAAIQLIHQFFHGPHQHRGQALYSSLSFGVGGSLGSLYAGYAWTSVGPLWTFLTAAATAVIAFVLVVAFVRPVATGSTWAPAVE